MEEGKYGIAQANTEIDKSGKIVGDLIPVRRAGEISLAKPEDVDFFDVSPN